MAHRRGTCRTVGEQYLPCSKPRHSNHHRLSRETLDLGLRAINYALPVVPRTAQTHIGSWAAAEKLRPPHYNKFFPPSSPSWRSWRLGGSNESPPQLPRSPNSALSTPLVRPTPVPCSLFPICYTSALSPPCMVAWSKDLSTGKSMTQEVQAPIPCPSVRLVRR